MNWDPKRWGSVASWLIAIATVVTLFIQLDERDSRINWSVVLIVGGAVLGIGWILKGKIYPKITSKVPVILAKCAGFIFKLLYKTAAVGIVALAISFFYTDHLPVALGKVLKEEGTIIAKATEQCILECVRENNEKVIITLVDSEEVRNLIYRDSLDQAKNNGYIEFIDRCYRTSNNWVEVPFTLTEDKIPGVKKLVLILKDERKVNGNGEKVSLLFDKVNKYLSDDQRSLLRKEIGYNSIFLTEDERRVINNCFEKYEGQDLYGLMYSVLNDPNMIEELRRRKAYDVEYYTLQSLRKDGRIKEDEKIVNLSNSRVVIKKTTKHLTPYDKIGIIGCYIDELR